MIRSYNEKVEEIEALREREFKDLKKIYQDFGLTEM